MAFPSRNQFWDALLQRFRISDILKLCWDGIVCCLKKAEDNRCSG
jgi:hypothetical protein